ncbi:MAG: hypothetical protein KIT02_14975 [Devosia sp.]|uniref:hypothetical protein n=1 Tax=Devosia sp. TaxID=1871048 RepID=UPI0024CD47CA|nr:hypothetical protein [Devosia sp.]UYN99207.1 MAG: hypothetical protein KIT02_14975 [Devosia sp.]
MRPEPAVITIPLAERHEALWLRLHAVHRDIGAIAAKKPDALVGESARIVAEGLIHDCRPFLAKPIQALPVAALSFAGLAVQLGQFLARLEDFENRHAFWDSRRQGRMWRTGGAPVPVMRLRQALADTEPKTHKGGDARQALVKLMQAKDARMFEEGFAAGRAARTGPPPADPWPPAAPRPTGSNGETSFKM